VATLEISLWKKLDSGGSRISLSKISISMSVRYVLGNPVNLGRNYCLRNPYQNRKTKRLDFPENPT